MLKNFGAKLRNSDGTATRLLDIFIILNLAFLALDVYIAHAAGGFNYTVEWLPIYFSLIAFGVLACVFLTRRMQWLYWCRTCFGWSAISIGIAGMLFHLSSHFFRMHLSKIWCTQLLLLHHWLIQVSACFYS